MAQSNAELHVDEVRSAVRFPLQLHVAIQEGRTTLHAITEDVSSTGILFTAERLPAVGRQITFELVMPARIMGGDQDVLLHCTGRIVRHYETASKKMAAAVIDEYSLKAEHHDDHKTTE